MAFVHHPLLQLRSSRRQLTTFRRPRWQSCATSSSPSSHTSTSLDSLLSHLREFSPSDSATSLSPTVHLVGTGPGDPGLLTLGALRLMQTADVVLYDRLVSSEILSFVNSNATMIYVGKEAGFHTRTQHDIHLLLRHFAKAGKVVVRLKGGDPYIFGRGGEEKEFLESYNVEVKAVAGITAAAGIAAALGIPLTMRGVANSVRFLTGHLKEGGVMNVGQCDRGTTMVVYMGLGMVGEMVKEFMKGGLEGDVPCVAVERGTTEEERVVVGTLAELKDKVEGGALKSPTLFIVGDVVRLSAVWKKEMGTEVGEGESLAAEMMVESN